MPKHTPEEKAAKAALAAAKFKVRTLLMKGQVEQAKQLAASNGFGIFDARLAPEYNSPAEPFFVQLEKDMAAALTPTPVPAVEASSDSIPATMPVPHTATPIPTPNAPSPTDTTQVASDFVNGWPVETDARVWGFCPNNNLVVIILPDFRKASMWKGRNNNWQIYDRVRARLESAVADPIYVPLPRPRY